jgi:NADPH-dependent ferric siderophore reductase
MIVMSIKQIEPNVVKFTLTSADYTDLFLRIKNRDPRIKIVWSDDLGQDIKWDETYGKEEQKK